MTATVLPHRGGSFTEYKITGPLKAVFSAIETIFSEYSPVGYGTHVKKLEIEYPGPNYTAQVWRANSAD